MYRHRPIGCRSLALPRLRRRWRTGNDRAGAGDHPAPFFSGLRGAMLVEPCMLLVLAGIQQASLLPPFLPRNHAATQAKLRFQRCLLLGADRRDLVVAMIARLVERDLILDRKSTRLNSS